MNKNPLFRLKYKIINNFVKLCIISIFLLLVNDSLGQTITWFRTYENPEYDASYSIVQTPDDGYIVVGENLLGLSAMRLNAFGDKIWFRILPGYVASDIIKTNDNNYIIVDSYQKFIKIDINGNIIWVRGPFFPNVGSGSVIEEANGNLIISGWKDTLGLYTKPFLMKLNTNGNLIWGRSYTTNNIDGVFTALNFAYDNNYLLSGAISNTYPFNEKLFFMKTDTSGEPVFFYDYDTILYTRGSIVCQNSNSTFIIGGRSNKSPFLAKIDTSGAILWFYKYINSLTCSSRGITNTYDRGYAFTGFWDTAGTGQEYFAYLIKTDSNGTEQFRRIYLYSPQEGNDGADIKQITDTGYVITGTRVNNNIEDVIVIKTDKNGFTQIVGINPIGSNIPVTFSFHSAYPNPFNPQTKLKFELPQESRVKLIIYDILGREVVKLLDEDLRSGEYSVTLNANNLPSGNYLAKLTAFSKNTEYSRTQKLVLLK